MVAARVTAAASKRRSSSYQREHSQERRRSSSYRVDIEKKDRRRSSAYNLEPEQKDGRRSSLTQTERSVSERRKTSIDSFRTTLFTEFPTEDLLKSGILWKKVFLSSQVWQPRQVAITRDDIVFARPGELLVIDRIPLLDITLIHRRSEEESGCRLHSNEFRREERGLQALPGRKGVMRGGSMEFGQRVFSREEDSASDGSAGRAGGGEGARGAGGKSEEGDAALCSPSPPRSPTRPTSDLTPLRASWMTNLRQSVRRMSMTGALQSSADKGTMMVIHTKEGGYNSGIPYFLQGESDDAVQEWVSTLKSAARAAFKRREREVHDSRWAHFRHRLGLQFQSPTTQFVVAAVILVNFAANVLSAELRPDPGTSLFKTLELTELACTIAFILELAVNLFVHSMREFWSDGWNYFDLFAVLASMLAIVTEGLPGFGVFRLIRVFRVIRLFHKLSSMRVIINAFIASCKPVLTAFVVVLLVTCLYAVLAVEFFSVRQPIYFGSFSKALFTLCQMGTGDNWGLISRETFNDGSDSWDPAAAVFFLSYVVLVGIVLLNIVVAVLLDEFIQSMARERWLSLQSKAAIDDPGAKTTSSLDPILSTLASLNDADDVSNRIQDLFELLDAQRQTGALRYQDLAEGLRKLEFDQVINLSREDYDGITLAGALCDSTGNVTCEGFHKMFRKQLHLFVQRRIANELRAVDGRESDTALGTVLYDLKQLNVRVDELHTQGEAEQGRMGDQLAVLAAKIDQLLTASATAPHCGENHRQSDDLNHSYGSFLSRRSSNRHGADGNNASNVSIDTGRGSLAPGFFNSRSQSLREELADKMVIQTATSRSLPIGSRPPSGRSPGSIRNFSSFGSPIGPGGLGSRLGSSDYRVFRSFRSLRRVPSSREHRSITQPISGSDSTASPEPPLPVPLRLSSAHSPGQLAVEARKRMKRRNSWHAVDEQVKQLEQGSSGIGKLLEGVGREASGLSIASREASVLSNASAQQHIIVSARPSAPALSHHTTPALLGKRPLSQPPSPNPTPTGLEFDEQTRPRVERGRTASLEDDGLQMPADDVMSEDDGAALLTAPDGRTRSCESGRLTVDSALMALTPGEISRVASGAEESDDESETDLGQGGVIWVSPLVRGPSAASVPSPKARSGRQGSAVPAAMSRVSHWLHTISRVASRQQRRGISLAGSAVQQACRTTDAQRSGGAGVVGGVVSVLRVPSAVSTGSRQCLGERELARLGIDRSVSAV